MKPKNIAKVVLALAALATLAAASGCTPIGRRNYNPSTDIPYHMKLGTHAYKMDQQKMWQHRNPYNSIKPRK